VSWAFSTRAAAAVAGVSRSTMARRRAAASAEQRAGRVPGRDGKTYPAFRLPADALVCRWARARVLQLEGWSVRAIAAEVGCSVGTVAADLRRWEELAGRCRQDPDEARRVLRLLMEVMTR
jgi:hypothetical protein